MKFCRKLFIILSSILTIINQSFLLGHATSNPNITEIFMEDKLFEAVTSKQPTLIMGYMNNCPHCTTLKKFFETLPKKYNNANFLIINGPKLQFHKKIAEYSKNAFKIPGYPAIVFIKNGKVTNLHIGGHIKHLEDKIKKLLA